MFSIIKITCNETNKIFIGYTTQTTSKYLKNIRHKKRQAEKGQTASTTHRQLSYNLTGEIIATTTENPAEVRQKYIKLYPACINDKTYTN